MDLSDYEFVDDMAKGNFGSIHLVRRKEDDKEFVIKKQEIDDYNFAINEVAIMSKLNHPNIVAFYDSWEENDQSYILMEYISGKSYYDLLQEASVNDEVPMTEDEALDFFAQMALAIDHLQRCDVIHRDIKPENILFAGPERVVKLIDFGLSIDISSELEVDTVNPNDCSAPEVWNGEPHTFKSDVWSIGALLHTVTFPFEYPDVTEDDPKEFEDFPISIRNILTTVLQMDPNERPESYEVLRISELKPALLNFYQQLGESDQEIVSYQIQDIIDSENEDEE